MQLTRITAGGLYRARILKEEVKVLCKRIIEENKPHRRASVMRIERPTVKRYNFHRSDSYFAASTALDSSSAAYDHHIGKQSEWLCNVAEHYILGMIAEQRGGSNDCREAKHHYNRLLSLARVKLDHRHPYICTLLERRGAVLFVERKLQVSTLLLRAHPNIDSHHYVNTSLRYFRTLHAFEYWNTNRAQKAKYSTGQISLGSCMPLLVFYTIKRN